MGRTVVVPMPFVGGLAQKSSDEDQDPAACLIAITNGQFSKIGDVDKRLGMKRLPNTIAAGNPMTTAITGASRLAAWTRSRLTLFTQNALYQQSAAENVFAGVGGLAAAPAIGSLPNVRPVRRPILTQQGAYAPLLCDVPVGGRVMRVAAYMDNVLNIWVTAYDADSGDVYLHPTLAFANPVPGTNFPQIVSVMYLPNAPAARQVMIIVNDGGAAPGATYGFAYNMAANTFSGTTRIVLGDTVLDAVPYIGDPAGGLIVMAVNGATVVECWYYTPTLGSVGRVITNVETIPGGGVGLIAPANAYAVWGESVWFAYVYADATGAHTHVACLTGDLAFTARFAPLGPPIGSATVPLSFMVRQDATHVLFTHARTQSFGGSVNPTQPLGSLIYQMSSGGVQVSWGQTPSLRYAIARPQVVNGVPMVPCLVCTNVSSISRTAGVTSSLQYGVELVALSPRLSLPGGTAVPLATVAPRQVDGSATAGVMFVSGSRLPFMSIVSTGNPTRFAVAFRTVPQDTISLTAVSGGAATGAAWASDFFVDTTLLYQSVEANSALHVACGVPMVVDGDGIAEDSFTAYPEFAYVTQAGSGSSLVGAYQYAIIFTFQDSSGNLHRSAPAFTNVLTLTGGQQPTVHFNYYGCTWRDLSPAALAGQPQVWAEIYRTTSNQSTLYLLTRLPASNSNTLPITYTDNQVDASLQIATVLYTTGGILDGVSPPALLCLTTHRQRLWGVDETLRVVWFTTEFSTGDAPRWNEALTFPVQDGGDITALSALDDKLVIFKADSIWIVFGDGPPLTGQGSSLTTPQRIAGDVGAIDWRSVVLMPAGLMFSSTAGIFLLGRDLTVTWIGKQVVDSFAAFPVVTSAVLVASAQHVRFTCSNASGTASIVLVFDYLLVQWTIFSYAQLAAPIVSACLSAGRYTFATSDGIVWQERLPTDATAYMDDNAAGVPQFVALSVTSPWLKVSGTQGYFRTRKAIFLGDRLDDHGLTIGVAVNYNPAIVQTQTWSSAVIAAANPVSARVQMHVAAAYSKAQSIQFTITGTAGAAMVSGQGCRFVDLSVELDNIGPIYRQVPIATRQ